MESPENRPFQLLSFIFTIILLTGCFDSDAPSGPDHYWGYLTPETKGIYYECGDLSGKTGPEGRFNYHEGEEVKFYLGGVELGTVTGAHVVTPFSLAGHEPVPADLDTAFEIYLNNYPKARNIMHFLLAINELYDNAENEYLYEDLVETLETMHLELAGKSLDFTSTAFIDFEAQLAGLSSSRGLGVGGLGTIGSTFGSGYLDYLEQKMANVLNHLADLEERVASAKERPEHLYNYTTTDYTDIPNPPVDGEVLTMEQLQGTWIIERGLYGDRANYNNPDSEYRSEWINFPQDNYLARLDGSSNKEDFLCNGYTKYFTIDETSWSFIIRINSPVIFRDPFEGYNWDNDPKVIPWLGEAEIIQKSPANFTGLWIASDLQWDKGIYNEREVQFNKYEKHEQTSKELKIYCPYFSNEGIWDGTTCLIITFTKPKNGLVKYYYIDPSATEKILGGVLRKVHPDDVAGTQTAFFPID